MEGYSLFFFGFTTKAAAQQQQQLGESEGTKASYGTEYRIEVSRKQNKTSNSKDGSPMALWEPVVVLRCGCNALSGVAWDAREIVGDIRRKG